MSAHRVLPTVPTTAGRILLLTIIAGAILVLRQAAVPRPLRRLPTTTAQLQAAAETLRLLPLIVVRLQAVAVEVLHLLPLLIAVRLRAAAGRLAAGRHQAVQVAVVHGREAEAAVAVHREDND